jgi:hypothetical protein
LFLLDGQWSEIPRKEEGEVVPAIEDDQEFRNLHDHEYRAFKSSRMPYTRRDQKEIVDFLGRFSL